MHQELVPRMLLVEGSVHCDRNFRLIDPVDKFGQADRYQKSGTVRN